MTNVRNAWMEVKADGSARTLATGPRSKDGGMSCRVLLRENGKISESEIRIDVKIVDGKIVACVYDGPRQILCKELAR